MCCKTFVYIPFTSMARPSPAKSKTSQGSKTAIPAVRIQNMLHLQLLTLLQPGKQYLKGNNKANKGSKATPSKYAVVPVQGAKKKPIPQNANKGRNLVAKNPDHNAKIPSRNLKRKEQHVNEEDDSQDEHLVDDLRNTDSEISEEEKETERDRDNDIVEDESPLTPISSRDPGSPPPAASKADTGAFKRKKSYTKVSGCFTAVNWI
jgi:hypothetical protein